MRRILFVCSGNLCRSPMAEYLLQDELKNRGVDGVLAESAGTIAMDGNKAATLAVSALAAIGVDMSGHRARGLDRRMIDEAGWVVTMERHHMQSVLSLAPGAEDKTVMIGEFLKPGAGMEIEDPYGGGPDDFRKALELIREAVRAMADKIAGGEEKLLRNEEEPK